MGFWFLLLKAKAKAEWLENRVRGAQQCEQRLVQLHSCINSIDAELCASLEQDLYADELPELCQVNLHFPPPDSLNYSFRMKWHHKCKFPISLSLMPASESRYRSAGTAFNGNPQRGVGVWSWGEEGSCQSSAWATLLYRSEILLASFCYLSIQAAYFWEAVINCTDFLFQATLQDVRNKFRKFQNPSELEPRLERMLRVLRDLEQSMCYIELASDDCEAIEGQLNNCIVSCSSLYSLPYASHWSVSLWWKDPVFYGPSNLSFPFIAALLRQPERHQSRSGSSIAWRAAASRRGLVGRSHYR